MQNNFSLNNRSIGGEAPVYIIAEISGNHGGDIDNAIKMAEIWFERGNRLLDTLNVMEKIISDRQVTVLRELTKIHGPIGLDIYSKTPEEISISILAELTKYRRKKNEFS